MLRLWILLATFLAMLEVGIVPGHRGVTPANDNGTVQIMDGGSGSPPPPKG